ncbi:MAG: OadG family protein [Deltaproteobacteria bacterium]|nr:OadG family protein [Deltaproteobacteria bacterium]
MQPVDWGQAWSIVWGGLLVVFLIMSLLAIFTHYMGKIVQGFEKRKKERLEEAAKEAKA